MLSSNTIAQIKSQIERLERAREHTNDDGIKRVIDGWIAEQKKKVAEGKAKDS